MTPERKFIHDISSPLGVVYGMVETVLDAMKARPGTSPEEIARLEKAIQALNKVTDLIQGRREEISAANASTPSSSSNPRPAA